MTAIPTALEVEMARAARWIEAQHAHYGLYVGRAPGERPCAHLYGPRPDGSPGYTAVEGDRPEDALCELMDKVEGRG